MGGEGDGYEGRGLEQISFLLSLVLFVCYVRGFFGQQDAGS